MLVVLNQKMTDADYEVVFTNTNGLLPIGNYVYQVTISNEFGKYHQCKVLTIAD